MRPLLLMIPLALSSAACSSQENFAKETGVSQASASSSSSGNSASAAGDGLAVSEAAEKDGAKWEFAYSFPAVVAAQPVLAEQLTAEKDKLLANEKAGWNAAQSDSPAECVGCRSRGFDKSWKVVANLPGWLSLSADIYTYTGGAHGMQGVQSLIWDKGRQEGVKGVEMFQSAAALDRALGARLCERLNQARAEKRGQPVDPQGGNYGFDDCQPVAESTVLVGSSNGKTFDRITIHFGPYVAGSYAEGAYELDFPVDAAILRAVKPEYRAAFSVKS